MKIKMLLLAGLAIAALTLIGCGNKSQPEENVPATNNTAGGEQLKPNPAATNDLVTPPPPTSRGTRNGAVGPSLM